ncbi:hypothetical protein WM11_01260 [Burkholderia ubonensis]|nr:hypothetical protein WM11_01260 [Burkholderia ubonensis]
MTQKRALQRANALLAFFNSLRITEFDTEVLLAFLLQTGRTREYRPTRQAKDESVGSASQVASRLQ